MSKVWWQCQKCGKVNETCDSLMGAFPCEHCGEYPLIPRGASDAGNTVWTCQNCGHVNIHDAQDVIRRNCQCLRCDAYPWGGILPPRNDETPAAQC